MFYSVCMLTQMINGGLSSYILSTRKTQQHYYNISGAPTTAVSASAVDCCCDLVVRSSEVSQGSTTTLVGSIVL